MTTTTIFTTAITTTKTTLTISNPSITTTATKTSKTTTTITFQGKEDGDIYFSCFCRSIGTAVNLRVSTFLCCFFSVGKETKYKDNHGSKIKSLGCKLFRHKVCEITNFSWQTICEIL